MKKIYYILFSALLAMGTLASCQNEEETPYTPEDWAAGHVTATNVGKVNTTIYDLKKKYCVSNSGATESRNAYNWWTLIDKDLIFEGVIVANDVSGNLYQTLLLRNIDNTLTGDAADQCIQLALKSTCLYPYFPLGQRVRVNLKNLYIGAYSSTPKIGHPYKTSYGNLNLGPAPFELAATNIQLIGKPNPEAPELIPLDFTTVATAPACDWKHCPQFGSLHGSIKAVDPINKNIPESGTVTEWKGVKEPLPKIFGPECLRDDGFGVDRELRVSNGWSKDAVIRTSTGNRVSFIVIPEGNHFYTGMMTYYSDQWQLTMRDANDIDNTVAKAMSSAK